jgi:hypothetical protein
MFNRAGVLALNIVLLRIALLAANLDSLSSIAESPSKETTSSRSVDSFA